MLVGADWDRPNEKLARLVSDGSLDDHFVTGTGVNASVYCMGVQANGKVLMVGILRGQRHEPKPDCQV